MQEYSETAQHAIVLPRLQDGNWIQKSCISSEAFSDNLENITFVKNRNYFISQKEQRTVTYSRQIQLFYEKWEAIYLEKIRQNQAQPFKNSVLTIFKSQIWISLIILFIGIVCHNLTVFILYQIFNNIVAKTVHSDQNRIMVITVVMCRLLRVFCCYYGEMSLNEIGLKMYQLVSLIITKKTLKCSPLSNKNIKSSELTKMMHTDCYNIITYPARIGVMVENTITHICLPLIAVHVAGLPGLIGILLLFTALFLRFAFKKMLATGEKKINQLSIQRIKATIEVLNIIKLIKVNSLQSCYFNKLRQLRCLEVVQLKFKVLLQMIQNTIISISKPLIMVFVCKLMVSYNGELHPQTLFTFNLCLSLINLQAIVNSFNYYDHIVTSFENIQHFMAQRDLNIQHVTYLSDPKAPYSVKISKGAFKWDAQQLKEEQKSVKQSEKILDKPFFSLKKIDIQIKKGELVAIIGGYGAGKTSLVESLLGEMDKLDDPKITINGTIAYASQVPWIMNDTIKNNILFGNPYNQKRYKEAIKYSSLQSDLQLFKHGDLSMIGKRGSTLSGGQKARVSFARALYSNADVYILDDILSAVDAHVGAFLFFIGIKQYLKEKTVLLITHSLYFVSHADRILLLQDGQIKRDGKQSALSDEPVFNDVQFTKKKTLSEYSEVLAKNIKITNEKDVFLMDQVVEEVGIFESFKVYIKRNSGLLFVIIISMFVLVIGCLSTYSQINLNNWSYSNEAKGNGYLFISLAINSIKITLNLFLAYILYVSKLFQSIHDDMIRSLLFSPYSYFQKVPTARIVNRLSNDLATNDKIITSQFGYLLLNLQLLLSFMFGVFYVYALLDYYYFIIFFLLFVGVAYYFFRSYFNLSIQVNKRQQDFIIPINSKYGEIIDGLPSIRAYKKVETIMNDFKQKLYLFTITNSMKCLIDGKIKLILLISSNLLAVLKALTLIFMHEGFRNNSIFLLFNFFSMEDGIFRFYSSLAAFAPRLQSLGKCQELTNLQQQAGYTQYLKNNWVEDSYFKSTFYEGQTFSKGQVVFQNYCLRYKPELEDVLKGISIVIKPGQKIGIVGRTGSGKSTLMLGLLRIIEAWSGKIKVDGVDISTLSLEKLRSNINIILQDHYLFTGTIKENIDPTQVHTDNQIIEALKLCGIWQKFQNKQGLETAVTQGGDNLSSGEKQLINISRSLLNPKKIVLIDEATASIDLQTDSLIQKVMKKQFADKTVLTIAHRINTVLDSDRILVLNRGQVSEFDSPSNLLKNENSLFAKLFKQSGKKTA